MGLVKRPQSQAKLGDFRVATGLIDELSGGGSLFASTHQQALDVEKECLAVRA